MSITHMRITVKSCLFRLLLCSNSTRYKIRTITMLRINVIDIKTASVPVRQDSPFISCLKIFIEK